MKTIIVTGGGSGGHIAPIRAIAPELKKQKKIYWIGSSHFESNAARDLGIKFKLIKSGKIRRSLLFKNIFLNIFDLIKVKIGFLQSFFFMIKNRPEKVFSTGGFVSVPVVIAARILRIPVIIHEQTIGFGLANKIGALCSHKILLAFPESQSHINKSNHHKIEVVGNPIRANLLCGNMKSLQEHFNNNFSEKKPILYITGGGQGSVLINDAIFESIEILISKFYVIHQTGKRDIHRAQEIKVKDYFPFDFASGDELADIYACADIVLSRAGAGTVNELDHFGIYGVFVPLRPTQNDEQMKNAEWFLKHNKGVIIPQSSFSKSKLLLSLEQYRYTSLARKREKACKISESTEKILKNLL